MNLITDLSLPAVGALARNILHQTQIYNSSIARSKSSHSHSGSSKPM